MVGVTHRTLDQALYAHVGKYSVALLAITFMLEAARVEIELYAYTLRNSFYHNVIS